MGELIEEENKDSSSLRSSTETFDGLHDRMLAKHNSHITEHSERMATTKAENYSIETGGELVSVKSVRTNVTVASVIEMSQEEQDFYGNIPDGGYGWVVAAVGFFINFFMFGTATVWGIFAHAYTNTVLKDKATTIQLMAVGTIQGVCLNLFTPISPLLAPLGARVTMLIGSVLLSLGIILGGFSTEVWHLYLAIGVLFGTGSSIVYMSVVAVIPQWFTTRRGAAMGISSAGTGFGGLALSPLVTFLIEKYGLPCTHRIIGLVTFGVCFIASMLIRTRIPPNHNKQPVRSPIKLCMLKDFDFVLMLCGVVIALIGYLVPLFYIPKYAASHGINERDSSTIVGVICAMNAIGRIVLGYFADSIGRLNMYILASTFSGLLCMLLWPFATTYNTLMAFAVLFGFTCGIYYALASPITAAVVGMENISSGLSILFVVSAVGSTGPPIASAIQEVTADNGYIGVQMFSGAVYIFGSLLCVLLKVKMTGSLFSNM